MKKVYMCFFMTFIVISCVNYNVNGQVRPIAISNNVNNCSQCGYMLEDLQNLYELVNKEVVNAEFFLNHKPPLGFSRSAVLTASIYNFEIFDNIVILFFSKTYYSNLKGNHDLTNVACCYAENPILLLFYQHFLKISNYDPTDGWFTKDIYKWAVAQNRFWENEDIKFVFEEIQKELEKKRME